MTTIVQPHAEPSPIASADSWNSIDRAFERMGRDWAIVYRCTQDLQCIVCRRPTRLMVCFSPQDRAPDLRRLPRVLTVRHL